MAQQNQSEEVSQQSHQKAQPGQRGEGGVQTSADQPAGRNGSIANQSVDERWPSRNDGSEQDLQRQNENVSRHQIPAKENPSQPRH